MQKNGMTGVIYMLLSGLSFVFNDAMLILAMGSLPPYEVLALRGLAGIVFALALLRVQGDFHFSRNLFAKPVLLRAGLELVAILTYILALANAPLGDVTAIFQTTPLLVLVAIAVFYREKTTALKMLLVFIGFAGAMLVAQPGQGTISPYIFLAFATAIFAALRDLAARQVSPDLPALQSTLLLIIIVCCGALIVSAFTETWVRPDPKTIITLIASGFFMMLGHHFTLMAYRNASAQTVAPFYYSFMVFAVIFGYLFFGDIPNSLGLAGMAIIVTSGLMLLRLEKKSA